MMPHGQDVPKYVLNRSSLDVASADAYRRSYTSQGRCAQSTPPSSAQRRPTLAPVTEVPSEFQYYHNMSLVVGPHPGSWNRLVLEAVYDHDRMQVQKITQLLHQRNRGVLRSWMPGPTQVSVPHVHRRR